MKRVILTTGIVLFLVLTNFGQNEEDVLRYSTFEVLGSARYMGLGGAFGALGADFSTLSSNPAGIGLYKKSEFSIAPSIHLGNSKSTYNRTSLEDGKNNFALENSGIVILGKPVDKLGKNPLENWQIGFGINRLKDFNNRVKIDGLNTENSILETYVEYSNGKNPQRLNSFDTRPAFDTFLIDTIIDSGPDFQYIHAYDCVGGFISTIQRKYIETNGSMNEWILSGGINISDKFYFGLTFGFPCIRYKQNSIYTEINQNPEKDLIEFNIYEYLETRGSGFNLKFGAISRPMPYIRLGVAFHTPTWYHRMSDNWSTSLNAYYSAQPPYFQNALSPSGSYDYRMQTPWKGIGSLAVIFGKKGLVSTDVEYINYSKATLSASDDGFYDENQTINNSFTDAINVRAGLEFNLELIQLRGGYGYYGSPFDGDINDGKRQRFSAGLGFRGSAFFADMAFSYLLSDLDYYLYGTESIMVNPVHTRFNSYALAFTFGFRFV